MFQHDKAPTHNSKTTLAWCREHLRGFKDKELWPPSSPDHNLLDYYVLAFVNGMYTNVPTTILPPSGEGSSG